jgi:hypothetical protein
MAVIVAYSLAGLFEVVGLALAFIGFNRTWKVFVDTETLPTAFRRSAVAAIQRAAADADRWVRNVLRMKAKTKVEGIDVASEMNMTGQLRARLTFGPLPSIEADPQRFAAEVHRRLQQVLSMAQDAQDAIADEREARTDSLGKLDDRLLARINEVAGKAESVAVGGLVEQVWGWIFVLAGVALGTFANILAAQT